MPPQSPTSPAPLSAAAMRKAMLEELMRAQLLRAAASDADPYTETSRTGADLEVSALFSGVWAMAPIFKHPAFSEEREWRLVLGPVDPARLSGVHWVERPNTLAPYVEFPLHEAGGNLDDIRWIAGPGPQQRLANRALGDVTRLASIHRSTVSGGRRGRVRMPS